MYKIVRSYHYPSASPSQFGEVRRRTVKTGLTLEQAQSHCRDPRTSSRTAPAGIANRVRRSTGCESWFDGYVET